MAVYYARFDAPLGFEADSDDQARLILNHIAEHILDAPLPHGAVWTALDETTLDALAKGSADRPVFVDRAERYSRVDPAAAGDCPICADHARRQNTSEETTR